MNIDEFKTRWLRGYIKPELFYLPVKIDNTGYKPMILEIETGDVEFYLQINMQSLQLGQTRYLHYNAKTEDGLIVTESDYPSVTSLNYVQEKPFLNIDWGDGENSELNIDTSFSIATESILNNNGDEININYYRWKTPASFTHIIPSNTNVTIVINGNIPSLSFNFNYGHYNYNNQSYLQKFYVHEWGNLGIRELSECFAYIQDYVYNVYFNWNKAEYFFKYVTNTQGMFRGNSTIDNEKSHLDWNILNDKMLSWMPELYDASSMFWGTYINYLPTDFTKNNTKLTNVSYIDYYAPINYVGDRVFANLPLIGTNQVLYILGQYNKHGHSFLEEVGDSLFENCINLTNVGSTFYCYDSCEGKFKGIKKIGKNTFKNCLALTSTGYACNYNIDLEEVGESMFEGCVSLTSCENYFRGCISLKKIGENFFKGCKNLRTISNFLSGCSFVEVPSRLFYDMEYNYNLTPKQNEIYGRDKIIGDSFYFNYSTSENFSKPTITGFSGNYSVNSSWDFKPELKQQIINKFENADLSEDLTVKLGTEMFNPTFLTELISNGSGFNIGNSYDCFFGTSARGYYRYSPSLSNYFSEEKAYTWMSGEFPPFWNISSQPTSLFYLITDISTGYIGLSGYGEVTGTYNYEQYDNTYECKVDVRHCLCSNQNNIPKNTYVKRYLDSGGWDSIWVNSFYFNSIYSPSSYYEGKLTFKDCTELIY